MAIIVLREEHLVKELLVILATVVGSTRISNAEQPLNVFPGILSKRGGNVTVVNAEH